MLGLRQAHRGSSIFPLTTLFQEFDTLKAFENGAFATNGGTGLKAIVLGHLGLKLAVLECAN